MKACLLLLLLFSSACFAQKQTATPLKGPGVKPGGVDSATYHFLFPVIKMIQVAEDPKKGAAFLMKDVKETNINGEAIYPAPYGFRGLNATVHKTATDRTAQTTTWEWNGNYFESSQSPGDEKGKRLEKWGDSLLALLNYKKGSGVNAISYLHTYFYDFTKPAVVAVRLIFTKGVYNTEQQAFDSLRALYKPLLLKPAFTADAARKWGSALQAEGFDKSRIAAYFQELLAELANSNTEAAFQMLLGMPDFMDYAAMNNKLPADKQRAIKEWAKKEQEKFYEAERRKVQGDPVVVQEKKQQADKALNGCSNIAEDVKYKYRPGITMFTTQNGTPFIVRLTAIDCRTKTVTVNKPGKKTAHDFEMKLPFEVYERYQKYDKQFHRCNACGGEGGERVTTSETKTKELPFGYFSGVQTKVTKTTTKTNWEACYKCSGTGWVLE